VITFSSVFYEPLFVSPLIFGKSREQTQGAFLGIRNIDINLTFNDGRGIFSFGSETNPATFQYQLMNVKDARLHVNQLSLPSSLKIPPKIVCPYNEYDRRTTTFNDTFSMAVAGAGESFTSNNLQLQSIPDKIIVYMKRSETNQSPLIADYFFPIQAISIKFGQKSGLLADASQYQLFKMSVDNGLKMDYYQWSGYAVSTINSDAAANKPLNTVGSICVIDPAKDLSLFETVTNGSAGSLIFR
jgi:hypothetical protein